MTTAAVAYREQYQNACKALEAIQKHLEECGNKSSDDVIWANVGDMGRLVCDLNNVVAYIN